MFYYEVLAASQRYHGKSALTYAYANKLVPGTIVRVTLQGMKILGIVEKIVKKPSFDVKEIVEPLSQYPLPEELIKLLRWVAEYYPGPLGMITQLFIPSLLIQQSRAQDETTPETIHPISLPTLTSEQSKAVSAITKSVQASVLLHGDTGTGKTRVYQEIIKLVLLENKSALVLTPEIGLTPQLMTALNDAFPNKVITLHSELTDAQRRKTWRQILSAMEPLIVVGARSALFSPLKNIGIVIVDEAHDNAYKQEQVPYYQTTRVAAKLAALHNAKLILGTATPAVTDYYLFTSKNLPIIRMKRPALANKHTIKTTLIDLRKKENFSRSPWLSDTLVQAIEASLRDGKQSLLFLNRRGSARLILCQDCGWQAMCPRCDLPLTYHGDTHLIQCHTCGWQDTAPHNCMICQSTNIIFKSIGTKSIVEEVKRLFPRVTIQRFDSDNTKADRLESLYDEIRDGKASIIVGTQMLSKGLDLPKLSVVGVVTADTGLYFPDFTAEERTFQMLTQVMGRVGRGHTAGHVVVQTYHPESLTIQAALKKDYLSFYSEQILERKKFGFPPFRYVAKLLCRRASLQSASTNADNLASNLRTKKMAIEIVGPSPAFTERTNNQYNWQIVVKSTNRSELISVIKHLPSGWTHDIDPTNLL